jgi:hypothetical protein
LAALAMGNGMPIKDCKCLRVAVEPKEKNSGQDPLAACCHKNRTKPVRDGHLCVCQLPMLV